MIDSRAKFAVIACGSLLTGVPALAQQPALTVVRAELAPPDARPRPDATPRPTDTMYLVLPLSGAKRAALEAFTASQKDPSSPNYHHWLTSTEVGKRFGASDADLSSVIKFARSQGLGVTHLWPNRMFVSLAGSVATVEHAFGVRILGYQRPARFQLAGSPGTFFAPDAAPKAPAAVAACISSVDGLSNLRLMQPGLSRKFLRASHAPQNPIPDFSAPLVPKQVSKVYNLDGLHALGANGLACQMAIYSPTQLTLSDIQTFANQFGLNAYNLTEVKIDGGPMDANAEVEACLDVETAIGQAPDINVVLYEPENGSIPGLIDALLQVGEDGVPVFTASYGYPEDEFASSTAEGQLLMDMDAAVATLDAQGVTLFASSGDTGAFGDPGDPSVVTVSWPASSAHVTAVGGTSLPSDNNGAWQTETAWSGSGGGLSIFFPQPSWQTGPGVNNFYSTGMRQVPDVAAMADPGTPGYLIYFGGGWYQVGGTSASSPLWATATRLMEQAGNVQFGHMGPHVYKLGNTLYDSNSSFAFHDITVGNDGLYPAGPNWDYVTGWGSVDFTRLYNDLVLLPNLHPVTPAGASFDGAWTSPVMIHAGTNSVAEPTTFEPGISYQFAVAIANDGPADAPSVNDALSIDGKATKFSMGAIPARKLHAAYAVVTTALTAGTHTIQLTANVNNTIKETSTSDNTFTRIITVGPKQAALSTLSAPAALTAGTSENGTITLTQAAPTGAFTVNLTATTGVVVPASVSVPAGKTSTTFTITASNVTSVTTSTISANASGAALSTTVLVDPAATFTFGLTRTAISGGTAVQAVVQLSKAAPAGGLTFVLASNSADAVVSTTSASIPAGQKRVVVPVNTVPVSSAKTATITATLGSTVETQTLTINP